MVDYLQSDENRQQRTAITDRGTQRLFSVKYLFGEAQIA